jgi:hypothetical protein
MTLRTGGAGERLFRTVDSPWALPADQTNEQTTEQTDEQTSELEWLPDDLDEEELAWLLRGES